MVERKYRLCMVKTAGTHILEIATADREKLVFKEGVYYY